MSCDWATFNPDTDAMTAMSATQTPAKIARRRRGSWMVSPGAPASEDRFVLMRFLSKKAGGIGAGAAGPGAVRMV
ncbi:hypothetical protein Pph01_08970 [Planotetraspora phitsanulokensis]|uniref:Uncharacterized protein n=1 Tax=Planotetraspora phitsanulokensis TaxID=575192 RepID=A0A8J3U4H0_9ACTN|nr:hypothetical protein Pph01_08970 [Planotetraspora phitsanulokensis]